jgi:hypothetical protein
MQDGKLEITLERAGNFPRREEERGFLRGDNGSGSES